MKRGGDREFSGIGFTGLTKSSQKILKEDGFIRRSPIHFLKPSNCKLLPHIETICQHLDNALKFEVISRDSAELSDKSQVAN